MVSLLRCTLLCALVALSLNWSNAFSTSNLLKTKLLVPVPAPLIAKNKLQRHDTSVLRATTLTGDEGGEPFKNIYVSPEAEKLRRANYLTRAASYMKNPDKIKDMLAGVVCALANIPQGIAFSNLVGVGPLVGLWSGVTMGLCSALTGGRPGLIAGVASTVSVPLVSVYARGGADLMHATLLLSALIQFGFAAARLGKYIKLVGDPAVYGFLNAVGLLLFKSQANSFKGLAGPALPATVGLTALSAAVTYFLPRLTTAVPSSLAALLVCTPAAVLLRLPVKSMADVAGPETFAGGAAVLPRVYKLLPDVGALGGPRALLAAALPTALSIAVIAYLQSLLAAKVVVEVCDSEELACAVTDKDATLAGIGLGNAVSAVLGGIGGCGLLPSTVLNMKSGGRGKCSSVTYALAMGAMVAVGAPLIGPVPLPALAGIMGTVAARTLQVKPTLAACRRAAAERTFAAKADLAALLLASYVCFRVDMSVGIFLALGVSKVGELLDGGGGGGARGSSAAADDAVPRTELDDAAAPPAGGAAAPAPVASAAEGEQQ